MKRLLLACAPALLALWLAGCAAPGDVAPVAPTAATAATTTTVTARDARARALLAPSGTLRVGVYRGSPSSLVADKAGGQRVGVAYELGTVLASQLAVPVEIVEFERLALVIDALRDAKIDLTFTNATEARARDIDFTRPLLQLELGYLVPRGSALADVAAADRSGLRIGVSSGSTSERVLTRSLRRSTIVPLPSLAEVRQALSERRIDAFATNKGILNELADQVPGSRILDGRWGLENMALGIPKGRHAAMAYLEPFAQSMRNTGQLRAIVQRAGLRGTVEPGGSTP